MYAFGTRAATERAPVIAAVMSCILVLVGVPACGGSSAGKKQNADPGDTIFVEGKVSMRGSLPFPILLLEAKDGVIYMIDSSPKAEELKRLDEMAVGVSAKVLPEIGGETPALSVLSYELLPLPTGEKPVVGVLFASPDGVALRGDDGSSYIIQGEFEPVFQGLSGAKIWIVGEQLAALNTSRGSMRTIHVTQYGLIKEAD